MSSSAGETTSKQSIPLPRHIAVVMDGNGRWATRRFLPRSAGHRSGVNATRKLVESCAVKGIAALTLFAFSSENWNRPQQEVSGLMSLFVSTLGKEISKLHKKNVCIHFIGDRSRFHEGLRQEIDKAEQLTRENSGLHLNIAANYGGRWDIVDALRCIVVKHARGELPLDAITEDLISRSVSLAHLPEPDLLIRTGGEQRISNFLLWQLAYTELYFTDTLWPDFDEQAFEQALTWYGQRQRRFGRTGDQVEKSSQRVS